MFRGEKKKIRLFADFLGNPCKEKLKHLPQEKNPWSSNFLAGRKFLLQRKEEK